MSKRIPVNELLRLACVHAENDLLSLVEAWGDDTPEGQENDDLRQQIRAYRMKRWGQTKLGETLKQGELLTLPEIKKKYEERE